MENSAFPITGLMLRKTSPSSPPFGKKSFSKVQSPFARLEYPPDASRLWCSPRIAALNGSSLIRDTFRGNSLASNPFFKSSQRIEFSDPLTPSKLPSAHPTGHPQPIGPVCL